MGSKSYDTAFSDDEILVFNLFELYLGGGGVVRGVVENLTPATTYVVSVAGVNGATRNNGLGMSSDTFQMDTLTGECLSKEHRCRNYLVIVHPCLSPDPPPPPEISDITITPPASIVDSDIRTVAIPLPVFSTINGPIR